MRYNDKEMIKLSNENTPKQEGVLQHMKPTGKDWSEWYQQATFKERYFKLIANLLFSYKLNETEPIGVLVLENAHIAHEQKAIPFAFSITFRSNRKVRDSDIKHIFACRCEVDVNKWISSLRMASYEYWRIQYHILKAKICMKTGQDPVLNYMNTDTSFKKINSKNKSKHEKKSTFHSHIQSSAFAELKIMEKESGPGSSSSIVHDLIEF